MKMTEEVKKRGRPAKTEAVAPALKELKIKIGLVSKNGLWEVVGTRGDLWIIAPTAKHTTAFGKMPQTEDQLKKLFEV
jgi:hypothetical protein